MESDHLLRGRARSYTDLKALVRHHLDRETRDKHLESKRKHQERGFLLLPGETLGESRETAELGLNTATVLEGTNAPSITQKTNVGARRRIKEKARAEERERKAGQDPEVTHSHQGDLVVLGLALNPERALGLVEVPLPIISARSAETTSLEMH